ncbi:MAG TPA: hypothetical protein VKU85_04910, partial [bacterium]|nr:hypothetical protein [bacterium]
MNLLHRIAGRTPGDVRAGFIQRRFLWIDEHVALSDAHWSRSLHPSDRTAFSDHPSIVFLREGTYVKTVGSARAVGDPTQVTLYDAGLEVRIQHPRGDRVRGTTFLLTPELLERMFADAGLSLGEDPVRPFRRLSAPVSSEAHLLYQRIVSYLSRDPAPDEHVAEEAIHRLLGLVLRDTYGSLPPSRRRRRRMRQRVLDVQASLAAREAPRTRLADVARTLGCSPEYASRVFAETT